MNLAARLTLSFALVQLLAFGASAQEQSTTTATTTTSTAAASDGEPSDTTTASDTASEKSEATIYEVRELFTRLVNEHPTDLRTVLSLEPSLVSNEEFLAGYPALRKFLQSHPEITSNPRFYLAYLHPIEKSSALDEVLEGLTIFGTFALIAFALAWLVRTIIDQKRWNRLSRTQTEVHTKILDRFGSSEELLAYIKTPAGSKFLESAPIPLHAEQPSHSSPYSRVIWSVQLGIVVAAGAIGTLLVSTRFGDEGKELFSMGVIALCVGAGFIASAFASLILSRRLRAADDETLPPVTLDRRES